MTVTIAAIRAHGVQKLLIYCLGKREDDWPCNNQPRPSIVSRRMNHCAISSNAAAVPYVGGVKLN